MEPVKIASITLKPSPTIEELRKELNPAQENFPVNSNDATEEPLLDDYSNLPTIEEEITTIIKRVEELPKSDTNIKALAKLKGALGLLS